MDVMLMGRRSELGGGRERNSQQQQPPEVWHFTSPSKIQTSSLWSSTSSCKLWEFFHVTSAFVLWPRPWRVALQNATAHTFPCPHGRHSVLAWCPHALHVWIDWGGGAGEMGEQSVCGHIPSSLATPFITLLSQLQTKPQCGASLLKSQHDKNSGIEVAQPTLPWHMGYFLVCVVEWDCGQALRLLHHSPNTSPPAPPYQW